MAVRTFVDSTGGQWEAFDVIPRATERRATDRRNTAQSEAQREAERRERDRRLSVGGRSQLTSQGWLCFEQGGGGERRRLSPIPVGWQRCTDAELEAYSRSARPVRRTSSSVEQASQRRR